MKENVRPEEWERKTHLDRIDEASVRYEVKMLMKSLNRTGGFHFLQKKATCILQDDGSSKKQVQYRFDGRELMYLDTQMGTFIPTMAEAEITTERWNSPGGGRAEWCQNYMNNICIDMLKKYIEYGREDLEQRVRPGVKVTGWESGGVTKLHCLVYGFHPRAVDVKWIKNGTDEIPSYETTHVLPNPDGTYQIRVAVEVIPKEGDSYSCYVDHSSLEEPLLVKWEPIKDSLLAVIISAVIIVLVLTSITAGVIIYRTSDTSSDAK